MELLGEALNGHIGLSLKHRNICFLLLFYDMIVLFVWDSLYIKSLAFYFAFKGRLGTTWMVTLNVWFTHEADTFLWLWKSVHFWHASLALIWQTSEAEAEILGEKKCIRCYHHSQDVLWYPWTVVVTPISACSNFVILASWLVFVVKCWGDHGVSKSRLPLKTPIWRAVALNDE